MIQNISAILFRWSFRASLLIGSAIGGLNGCSSDSASPTASQSNACGILENLCPPADKSVADFIPQVTIVKCRAAPAINDAEHCEEVRDSCVSECVLHAPVRNDGLLNGCWRSVEDTPQQFCFGSSAVGHAVNQDAVANSYAWWRDAAIVTPTKTALFDQPSENRVMLFDFPLFDGTPADGTSSCMFVWRTGALFTTYPLRDDVRETCNANVSTHVTKSWVREE